MKSQIKLPPPPPGLERRHRQGGVTKDDARDPSKRHAISRAFVTTLGEPFCQNTLMCEECPSLQHNYVYGLHG